LLGAIRAAWHRPAGLFAVNPRVLEVGAALVGARKKMYRLTRSLEVDVTDTMRDLAWTPAQTLHSAIAEMALAFRDEESH
jgi:protein involved in temperature-dependent protein secretion